MGISRIFHLALEDLARFVVQLSCSSLQQDKRTSIINDHCTQQPGDSSEDRKRSLPQSPIYCHRLEPADNLADLQKPCSRSLRECGMPLVAPRLVDSSLMTWAAEAKVRQVEKLKDTAEQQEGGTFIDGNLGL